MLFCYLLLSIATCHNVVRFVIKQRRYKFFHIVYFYILVALIILTRVVWFAFMLQDVEAGSKFKKADAEIGISDCLATYLELLLGIQQVSSMYELYLMIKTSILSIEPPSTSNKS